MRPLFTFRLATLIFSLILTAQLGYGQITEDFITTWEVTEDNLTVKISRWTELNYNYRVDWGDGTVLSAQTGNPEHTYSKAGTYTIEISGVEFPGFRITSAATKQIRTVEQWGNNRWETFESAFKSCTNLVINATDAPNLGRVSSMDEMFSGATILTGDLSDWNTERVTSMEEMFKETGVFNSDLSNWDVGKVTNMREMFSDAASFNSDLSDWDVSSVTDMSFMFEGATAFNSDLNDWNVSKVTDMEFMFYRAAAFNSDLDNWNVGNVTQANNMFGEATAFNGEMTDWDLSKVTDLTQMFDRAAAFNGDVSGWKVQNVTNMSQMFSEATAFNQPMNDWDVSAVTDMSSMFSKALAFNQSTNDWDVSSVTTMEAMFSEAVAYNQSMNDWDVSSVTSMVGMFSGASSFNNDISTWDVSKVTNMGTMFSGAVAFNSDISAWDVSSLFNLVATFSGATAFNSDISNWTLASTVGLARAFQGAIAFNQPIGKWDIQLSSGSSGIFENATAFNQDLGNWNVEGANQMTTLFSGSGMSVQNYNATLFGWSQQSLQSNVSIDVDGLEYCNIGELSRQKLIADYNWTFSGDSEIQCPPTLFSGVKDSDTQLTVTFDVGVQTNEGNPTDFTLIDAFGTNFAVAAQGDGTAGDSEVVLTVANLSTAIGDLTVSYTNNNSEIKDTTPNELEAGDSDTEIDTDVEAPTLVSAVRDSDTQITLTFNEPVQTKGGGLFAFTVTDDDDNSFEVTAQADGTARDNQIVLTVENLAPAVGLITFNYINNTQISDFGDNLLDDASALVCADGFSCNLIVKTLCVEESYTLNSGQVVINPEQLVQVDTVGTVITQYRFTVDESVDCCPDGFTCDVIDVNSCTFPYTSPLGNTTSVEGRVIDMDITNQIRNVYNVTFDRAELAVDIYQNATIAETGSVTYQANTNATGVLSFDKSEEQWVNLNALQDDLDGASRSIFMWVKSENNILSTHQTLFAINSSSGGNVSLLWIDNDDDNLELNRGGNNNESASFNMGGEVWHYVGYTYNAGSSETVIYVNGIENDRFVATMATDAGSQFSLGQEFDNTSVSNPYNGDMAEISVWSEVLTPEEIRAAMRAKISNTHTAYDKLVGYYSVFGECDDDVTVLKDHSGNGNNGTFQNGLTQDFQNVQSIDGFNSIGWFDVLSWKKDGAEVSTASEFTTDVAAGSYQFTASRSFMQSSDTWSMTLNSNAATVDNLSDEVLCEDSPITKTVSTNAVNYLDFEKDDDNYIEINGLADDLVGKSRSVFMWFKKESGVTSGNFYELLVFQGADVDSLSRFYIRDTELLALWDGTNDRVNSTTDMDASTWYFIGFTYDHDAKVGKVYVNGTEEDSGTLDMPLDNGWLATLGAKYNDNGLEDHLDGQMAELSIWDRVLTAEEITVLMSATPANNATNLVASYGTMPGIADNQLRDLTANGHNGLASHGSIFVTNEEVELTDYDATTNYLFSWKKGETEFDTDGTGNITIDEGTTAYSVTYGTPLFQKTNAFGLSYTNLLPTQPVAQTAGVTGSVTFQVDEIEGATYQWYERAEGFTSTAANENGFSSHNQVSTIHADGNNVVAGTPEGLSISNDGGLTWTTIDHNQEGFANSRIVFGAHISGDIIYAGTSAGLSISKDGGSTWTTTLAGQNGYANDEGAYVIYKDGDTVYAGTGEGLSISKDGGDTWTTTRANKNGFADSNSINDIYLDVNKLYVATSSGLSVSLDGGSSWTTITSASNAGFPSVDAVNSVYADGDNIYVGSIFGVFFSSDGGSTWAAISAVGQNGFGLASTVYSVYVNAGTLIAGTSKGVYTTTDNGASWSILSAGGIALPEKNAYSIFAMADKIYVGMASGGYILQDKLSLTDIQDGTADNQIQGSATHQLTLNNLTLNENGTEYFVIVSKDGCSQQSDDITLTVLDVPVVSTFTPANGSTDVALDTELNMEFSRTITAGSGELKIFNYATDALVQTFAATDFTIDGNTASITPGASLDYTTQYYITLGANLVQDNSNAGNLAVTDKDTWSFRTTCEPLVLSQPDDENGVLGGSVTFSVPEVAGANYQWFERDKSPDPTFTPGPRASLQFNVTLDFFADDQNLYLGTENALLINRDNGGWTPVTSNTTGFLDASGTAAVFAEGLNIYAGNTRGLAISNDGGTTWRTVVRNVNGFGTSSSVQSVYASGVNVYAGTRSGLSISSDGGVNWTTITKDQNGFGSSNSISAIVADRSSIFVGTNSSTSSEMGGAITTSNNGGTTWSQLATGGVNGFIQTEAINDLYIEGDNLYTVADEGISISSDRGLNWTTTLIGDNGLRSVEINSVYAYQGVIFVGNVRNQVEFSEDGGATWNDKDNGGARNDVFVSGNGFNVYKASLNNFTIVEEEITLSNTSDTSADNQIAGATTNQLTVSDLSLDFDNKEYFVRVTVGDCEETSEIATLKVGEIAPSITTLLPADNAVNVAPTADISITFDQTVVKGTGNIEIRKAADDQLSAEIDASSAQVSIEGSKATLSLGDTNLDVETEYYITIPNTAFKNAGGLAFAGISDKTTWTFSTKAAAVEPLLISSSNPSATVDARIDRNNLFIYFDEEIAIGEGTLTVFRASDDSEFGSVSAADLRLLNTTSTHWARASLPNDWELVTAYYVQLSAGFIKNADGTKEIEAIEDKTTLTFTGESFAENIVTRFSPATGSNTYVADSEEDLVLYTSENVGAVRDMFGAFKIYKASNDELVKTIEFQGENDNDHRYGDDEPQIRFEFEEGELAPGTEYYVLLDDGFIVTEDRERYHVGISDANTWRFSTLAVPSTPTLTSTSPAAGATDVNITADIELTYSENIKAHVYGETMNVVDNVVLYDADNNVVQTFPANTLSYSGTTVTINPTNDLDYNATYYLLIDAEVFISNNRTTTAAVTDPTALSFTTGSPPNTAPVASAQDFTGSLEVNQQLTGSHTYTDADTDAESGTTYQWYVADDATGANSIAISGATVQNYSLTTSEAGKFVALAITPNDGTDAGTEVFTTYKGVVAAAVIPTLVSTVPTDEAKDISITPSLSLVLSEPVTLSDGRIIITDGSSSISFAANSTNVSVSGSTVSIADVGPFPLSNGTYYTVTFEPSAFVDADGNNSAGLTSQTVWNFTTVEAQVAPVASAVNIKKSIVVDGTLEGTYSYSDGNDDPESGSTYQWYRADDAAGSNKAAISGADSQDYIAATADNNKFVSFEVTPNDGNLAGTAVESDFFGPVLVNDGVTNIPPAFTSDPLVTILDNVNYSYTITTEDLNSHVVGLTKTSGPAWLTLSAGVLSGDPAGQVGDHVVVLTADDGNGGTKTQEFTVTVEASNTAPSVNGIEVTGTTTTDEQLTGAYNFIDAENDADNSSYKWYRADDNTGSNKTAIAGATATTYTLTSSDAGKFISFEVTPNDGKVDGSLAESTVVGAIAKKVPTLSLTAISKVYGDADFDLAASTNSTGAITYSFNNDQTSANLSGATVTLGNVGEITVDVSLAEDAEYQARQVQGSITVGSMAIEVTATSASKAVGESDPSLAFTVTSGAIVGSDEVVTISRDAGEAVGTYAMTFTDGTAAANYDITKVDGLFTINAVAITVTADATTKTYGAADPAFTYNITTGALNGADVLSGAITREAGEDVGTYALQSSLFNSDYDITFVPANLTVGKADLTATGNDQTKFIGEANPELTISYTGFVNGDTETNITTPTIATLADESSPLGNYDITLTGGAATNYNLSLVNGTLTVSQRPFITTWEITSSDVNRTRTFFTAVSGQTYLYDVDWGDNTVETNQAASAEHAYTEAGTYTIKITGQFPQIQTSFGGLESVEQWGDIVWESMESAFVGSSFSINATDAPDFSQVTSMKGMFDRANIGTADLTGWEVSTITDMSDLFKESDFNGDISNWDVSNVTNMSFMFAQTANFNGDITGWNTSGVQDMSYVFYFAEVFNQAIDSWNVSSVANMNYMFADAAVFNQDLNSWNVGSVTTMEYMFDNALLFNGNITSWDVSGVTDMSNMFDDAKVFNQDIDGWNVSNVTEMNAMFNDAEAFNQDLNSWSTSKVTTFVAMFQNTDVFNGVISNWDVSNATRLERMFEDAHAFNQDISNWQPTNTENLTAMFRDARAFNQDISSWRFPNAYTLSQMFYEAAVFNQDISSWETGSITDMSSMFEDAEAFNQDISGWDVSAVTSFGSMFRGTLVFNQDISQWDMSAATGISSMFKNAAVFNQDISGWTFASGERSLSSMSSVFENAAAFDQDLSSWDISNITSLYAIFSNSGMSIASYDATLIGWAAQEVQDEVEFGVEGLQYCAGNAARQSLTDDHNWTIENDSQSCNATVTIADASGNEDDGNITVTLTLDAFVVDGLTVDVSTADGTAAAGTDYTAITSQTITFAGTVGETQTFTITPTADTNVEGNETLTVSMSNLVTGTENTVTTTDDATVTIIGDDQPVVSFASASASDGESVSSSDIEVNLNQAGLSAVAVDYTVSGTASGSGTDYTLAAGTLTFAVGDVSETISLSIINDERVEADETVIITLSNASGASIGTNAVFTYTIEDNDQATVSLAPVSAGEGDGTETMTATLDKAVDGGFTVDLITAESSAIKGVDYTGLENVTLTFAGSAGETQTTTITLVDDEVVEFDESISVLFDNLGGTNLDVTTGDVVEVTITDNDEAAVTIADVTQLEDGESFQVTATLDKAVSGGFTVAAATADGTATVADGDYTALSGVTLTFAGTAGETQTFEVSPTFDTKLEANETLTVSLSNLAGTTLPVAITDQATLTITNDDAAAITIEDVSGNESDGPITLTATLDNAVQGGFSVAVSTADGTATIADSDYTALTAQILTFVGTAGETQTFTVSPTNDIIIENDETLTVSLSGLNTNLAVDISDGATVTITNDDFNNAPTDVTLSATSIDENNALGVTIGSLSTTDADAGDTHTYSLVAGTGSADNGFFFLEDNALKSSIPSFNFEFQSGYTIRVQTDDGKGGIFAKAIAISINDVNEAPFQISISNRTISESDEAQDVGVLMTLDPDNGDSFTYTLVDGEQSSHNAQFEIVGSTVRTAGAIDFEEGASRDFRVRATDSGGLTFEWGFTVIIEDVAEEPVRPITNEPGGEVKNVFSPNGDGVNETWVIEDLQDNPVNEVRVYAQGGKLIYSRINYQNDWNGTFRDDPVPDGTYYYEIIIFENSQSNTPARIIKGFLTIIRNR